MTQTETNLPVAKDQMIEIKIERLNHDGEGVGKVDGFTVFVPGTAPEDLVSAKIISLQKTYARALVEEIISESPHRITPICEHYDDCGGCQLQHINYEQQLVIKRNIVIDALRRIGGLDVPVHPALGMAEPWQYRNKAQVPVAMDGTLKAGFYEKRTHKIVDLDCCHIQHPSNDLVVHAVRAILKKLAIPIYDEKNHTGLIRHIVARTSFSTGEILVILVTNGRKLPRQNDVVEAIRKNVDKVTGIVQNINMKQANVILGNEDILLWGKSYLQESLDGLSFHVSPRSFFQVNTLQTDALYAKVREYAALTGQETVYDLYCGIGTISLYLSRYAGKVIGVELVNAAVKDARKNAELNGITNVEFHKGAAEQLVPERLKKGAKADVVIVDPPRKGCDERLLAAMVSMKTFRIVYVSCNPATLARDLKYLTGKGYTVTEVQPVDMFPHTSHVETVVLIERR